MNRKSAKVINNKTKTIYRRLRFSKIRRCDPPHNTSDYLISLYERLGTDPASQNAEYCNQDNNYNDYENFNEAEDICNSQSIELGGSMIGLINCNKVGDNDFQGRNLLQESLCLKKPMYYYESKPTIQNFQ